MSEQKDVFTIIDRMERRARERQEATRPQLQEVELESFPCSSCGRFAFPEPTTCYWCREETA